MSSAHLTVPSRDLNYKTVVVWWKNMPLTLGFSMFRSINTKNEQSSELFCFGRSHQNRSQASRPTPRRLLKSGGEPFYKSSSPIIKHFNFQFWIMDARFILPPLPVWKCILLTRVKTGRAEYRFLRNILVAKCSACRFSYFAYFAAKLAPPMVTQKLDACTKPRTSEKSKPSLADKWVVRMYICALVYVGREENECWWV